MHSGRYRLVSAGRDGTAVGGTGSDVTRDCRTVAFTSTAPALAARGVAAGTAAAFARDLRRDRLVRLSRRASGRPLTRSVSDVHLSARGDVASFSTDDAGVVRGDTNATVDVFTRRLRTGTVRRVSLTTSGEQLAGRSSGSKLSRDGRSVAFLTRGAVPGADPVDTFGFVRGPAPR